MGWSLRVPRHWQPHRIMGRWERGAFVAGDAERVLLQIKWIRTKAAGFDAERWIARRLRREGRGLAVAPHAPRPPGFTHAAWAREAADGDSSVAALWYGWAPAAGLLLEAVVPSRLPADARRLVMDKMLPGLCVEGGNEPGHTAVLGRTFEVPAGFRLMQWTLRLGDVLLRFESARGARLTLRQVYPAQLALSRRTLARWLEATVQAGSHRRLVADAPQPYETASGSRTLRGVWQRGWKRLSFPLGRVAARASVAAAVHDATGDLLLIAELDARGACSDEVLRTALLSMGSDEPTVPADASAERIAAPDARSGEPPRPRRWWQARAMAPRLSRAESLGACPVRAPVVRTEAASNGGLRLSLRAELPRWYGWLAGRRCDELQVHTRSVELDALGREVYEACDGATTVQAILARFAQAHCLGPAEAELAVTRFLQLLVRRGLIGIQIRKPASGAA
jgi:hypothetical protein